MAERAGIVARGAATVGLVLLVAWGVALGAWVSAAAAVVLGCAVWGARGCAGRAVGATALAIVAITGPVEVLVRVHAIGDRARAGALGPRDQLGVYGFNVVLAGAATAAGFAKFGEETLLLGVPWSLAGACPPDRLAGYGSRLPRAYAGHVPRLRVWRSDLPMRSPKVRRFVRTWADALPVGGGRPRDLGPVGPITWTTAEYLSPAEANQVPAALDTPTTRLTGRAVHEDGAWRLDLVVDAAIAYPERSALHFGPFVLEEGMFHDARAVLRPYCAEYRWSVAADDPFLRDPDPVRGPLERLSTAVLRAAGAGHR